MKSRKISISAHIQGAAISFVTMSAMNHMKGYVAPARKGTAKGKPIGFSRKKLRAAILMALFPNIFQMKDISGAVDVSLGVLKLWCREEAFKSIVKERALELGRFIVSLIDCITKEDEASIDTARKLTGFYTGDSMDLILILIDILACLDPLAHEPFHDLEESVGKDLFQMINWRLVTSLYVYKGDKNSRKLLTEAIDIGFDTLQYPEKHAEMTPELRTGICMNLKTWMLLLLENRR
jgi:hypothetical protein